MRMARLHIDGVLKPFIPTSVVGIGTEDDDAKSTALYTIEGEFWYVDETVEQTEAEINAALRDIEGAEQRTRLDELLSDCLRKEAADDTA